MKKFIIPAAGVTALAGITVFVLGKIFRNKRIFD